MRTFLIAPTLVALCSLPLIPGVAQGDFTLKNLASFNETNGASPFGPVTIDAQGNLYGTTFSGGANTDGTVYKIAAGTGILSTIATFNVNGGPEGGLTMDAQGNLYGTTYGGGTGNNGTVFKITASTGALSTVATFNGSNTANPMGGLTLDAQGNLYGTTSGGGPNNGLGTVFKITAATGTLSTIATFNGTNGAAPNYGNLVLDTQGNLYGTTSSGGTNNDGTIFKIAAGTGALTTLVNFNVANGSLPRGALTMDAQGNLYGTTYSGGKSGDGTVFEVASGTGTLSTLLTFDGTNGNRPTGTLTFDTLGNLYGTTFGAGISGIGTAFEIAAGTGLMSTLASFSDSSEGTTGAGLLAGLTLDTHGNLYGTTVSGGADSYGTVFELVANSAVVPEPVSLIILGQAGVIGLALILRSRSRRGR